MPRVNLTLQKLRPFFITHLELMMSLYSSGGSRETDDFGVTEIVVTVQSTRMLPDQGPFP